MGALYIGRKHFCIIPRCIFGEWYWLSYVQRGRFMDPDDPCKPVSNWIYRPCGS